MAHGSPALAHKLDKYRTMCECFLVLFIPAHREQPATCGIILLGDSMVPHPGHETVSGAFSSLIARRIVRVCLNR